MQLKNYTATFVPQSQVDHWCHHRLWCPKTQTHASNNKMNQ